MKDKKINLKNYDAWKTGGDNPDNLAVGPCAFCDGEGFIEDENLPGEFELCRHCDGWGECGCQECEDLLKERNRS